ncbi:hypothetical protein CDL15_Pgr005359 [Punica granatum]|uniref:Uncharacterized protein n=1 Tax=Punica granatum TaxID=22663 RepID=A0A218XE40_PUNGR|nr:hypothetical protein CDL15_Pgr005359 [Punica granatum]
MRQITGKNMAWSNAFWTPKETVKKRLSMGMTRERPYAGCLLILKLSLVNPIEIWPLTPASFTYISK